MSGVIMAGIPQETRFFGTAPTTALRQNCSVGPLAASPDTSSIGTESDAGSARRPGSLICA
jgi:hypothetical protein